MKLLIIFSLLFLVVSCHGEKIDQDMYISVPLSEISSSVKKMTHSVSGRDVRYMLVKDTNEEIKVAFDACDVCSGRRGGYKHNGNDVVCNNCGRFFRISDLGSKNRQGGGCWPSFLAYKIVGDKLIIKKKDLEDGAFRF